MRPLWVGLTISLYAAAWILVSRWPSRHSSTGEINESQSENLKLVVKSEELVVGAGTFISLREGRVAKENLDSDDESFVPELFKILQSHAQNKVLVVEWQSGNPRVDLRRQISHTAEWAGVKTLVWKESL